MCWAQRGGDNRRPESAALGPLAWSLQSSKQTHRTGDPFLLTKETSFSFLKVTPTFNIQRTSGQ